MTSFVVDSTGLTVPRYADARARIVELWREEFGPNVPVHPRSTDGQTITIAALLLTLVWQGLGATASNSALRTSEGNFVDLILDLFARRRLDAAASTASLVWYGTDATVVPSGSLVETGSGDGRFATDATATVGDGDDCWVLRIDAVEDSTHYTVTIDGNDVDFTSSGSATLEEVLAGVIAALVAEGHTVARAGEDDDGLSLLVLELAAGATVTESGAVLSVFPAVRVAATCTETGAVQLLTGSPSPVSAISGIVGVTSTEDATVGRARESDPDFKARHFRTLSANGSRSSDAIAARLLLLDGVSEARVYENEGPTEDDAGRPGHSFEPVVRGGDDDEIAALLLSQKPSGIRCYGRTVQTVLPVRGASGTVTIGHTRPTTLYAHLEVTITAGEGYPSSGTPLDSIAAALVTYLTTGAGAPRMGADLYRVALYGVIVSTVPGIAGVAIRTATTAAPDDSPTFAAADLEVDELEVLDFDSARVTVL